jgi:hypothetical protein
MTKTIATVIVMGYNLITLVVSRRWLAAQVMRSKTLLNLWCWAEEIYFMR